MLSFGATKNGALAAEAVVFFDPALVRDFELRRKRAGHLLSKSRYVAAQLLAYLESRLSGRRNAQRTNRLAQDIARGRRRRAAAPGRGATRCSSASGSSAARQLRAAGFEFYDWGPESDGEARLVVSWDQPEEEVERCARRSARLAG